MQNALLIWPECWREKSNLDRFFLGIPYIGLDNRLRRYFQSVLKSRKENIYDEWQDVDLYNKQIKISFLIKRFFGWCSHSFLPKDKCDVLMWDFPYYNLASVEFFLHLENIGVLRQKIDNYNFLKDLDYDCFIKQYIK